MSAGSKKEQGEPNAAHASKLTAAAAHRQLLAWPTLMDDAMQQAQQAAALGEVPVGALVLHEERVIARGYNRRECDGDPLGHAEILAIRAASQHLGRWRLTGCTLVVTLEPCPMCAGAIVNARLDRLVFGAYDVRGGAVGSLMNLVQDNRLNHRAEVLGGVRAAESAALLKSFFAMRRAELRGSILSS